MEIEIDSVSLEKRFLRYVQIDTQSAPIHSTYPSTEGQWTLLHLLKFELEALGLDEVVIGAKLFWAMGMSSRPQNLPNFFRT